MNEKKLYQSQLVSQINELIIRSGWKKNSGLIYKFCESDAEFLCSCDCKWHPAKESYVFTLELHSIRLNVLSNFLFRYGMTQNIEDRLKLEIRSINVATSAHLRGANSCTLFLNVKDMILDSDHAGDVAESIINETRQICMQFGSFDKLERLYRDPTIYRKPILYMSFLKGEFEVVSNILSEKNDFGEQYWDPGLRLYLAERT